jgi:hypothetical protein
VSHLKERKEKDCLNCGANVHGRFCQVCGQENIEPKENFWHLLTHFMYDVTHFDGKFFSTLRYLLFRPGFLSHEYLKGRRASYLHPIRMYVFTSALFFLVIFAVGNDEDVIKVNTSESIPAAAVIKKLEKRRAGLAKTISDTLPDFGKNAIEMKLKDLDSDIANLKRDTTVKNKLRSDRNNNDGVRMFSGTKASDTIYKNVHIYDSVQSALPPSERDNFFRRRFARQNIHLKEKYNNDNTAVWKAILEKFRHLFPQMLFVSLPLFALALRLLYIRRKRFFYVNHVVFTIHLYCGTFIIILTGMVVNYLAGLVNFQSDWITGIFTLAGFFYWYKSLRNFYEQRRAKTILKYFLAFLLSTLIMAFIFTVFFIFSAMSI